MLTKDKTTKLKNPKVMINLQNYELHSDSLCRQIYAVFRWNKQILNVCISNGSTSKEIPRGKKKKEAVGRWNSWSKERVSRQNHEIHAVKQKLYKFELFIFYFWLMRAIGKVTAALQKLNAQNPCKSWYLFLLKLGYASDSRLPS